MEGQHDLEAVKIPKKQPYCHKPPQLSNVSNSRSAPSPRSFGRGPVQRRGMSYITLNLIRRSCDEQELHLITALNLSGSNLARKIKYIENLDGLRSLHSLDLSDNEIEKVEKLDNLRSLVELNLSCNRLPCLDGLENLVQLRVLNVEGNCISAIPAWLPRKLKQLRTLALARNHIGSLQEISKLHRLTSLTSLTVVDNPISELCHCTPFIVHHLRTLESLDNVAIGRSMRREAVERFSCVEIDRLEAELFEEREKIVRMEEEMSAMEAAVSREKAPAVSQQGKDTLAKLQLELQMKNELLAKKTSELALSHQRQYELEQEMTFYKLDAKFDRSRLSELESLLHTSSDFDHEAVGNASSSHEAPYLGRARYKPNSIASETFVHSTSLVGVHQTLPPPRKPTISKLDLPQPAAPQTAVAEESYRQLTFALQALRTILGELQGLIQEGSTTKEDIFSTTSPHDAIPDNQVPAKEEDLESLTHALAAQMNELRKVLQNGKDTASELEAQKVLTAAQLERMTLEIETLRASRNRVGSTNRRTQTDVLASDDEKLIFELQTKLGKMENELAEHKTAVKSLQQELKQLHLEKQSILLSQLDRASLDMADVSSQTDHTHDTVTALEKSVATLNKEREGLQLELLGRARELEAAMQDVKSLQEELEAAASRSEHAEEQDSQTKDVVMKTSSVACQTAPLPNTAHTSTQASMPETRSTPEQMQQLISLLVELSEKLQNSLRTTTSNQDCRVKVQHPEIVMKLLSLLQDIHHLKTLLQEWHSRGRKKTSTARVRISRSSPEMHTRKHLVSWKNEASGSPHEHGLHGAPHCFVSTSTPKAGQPEKTETVYDRSARDGLESHTKTIKSQMATRSTFPTEEDSTENKSYIQLKMTKSSKHHDTGGQATPPISTPNGTALQISPIQAESISNLAGAQTDHEIFCGIPEHQFLEAEVSQLRDCLEEVQLRAKETLQNSRSLHATIEQQTAGLLSLCKQRENLSREIRNNEYLLVSQARELEVRQMELKKAEEKLQTILRKKSEAEQRLQSLTPSLERDKVGQLAVQKRSKLEALVVECSSLEARKHTLIESIEKQRVLYGELSTSIDRQEARLTEMSEVLAKLEGRRKVKEEEIEKAQEENEKIQQSVRLVAADIQDLKRRKAHLVTELAEEKSALSAAKLELQKHKAALKEVKEAQAKAQSNLFRCRKLKLTQEAQSCQNSRRQQTQEQLQSAAVMELEAVQLQHAAAVWRLKELQSAIEVKEKELRGWGQKVEEMEVANQRLQQEQKRRQRLLESYNEKIQTAREQLRVHSSQDNHSLEVQHASFSSGLSSRLEELVHRNEKLVQAVHGMKTEARQHQTDREKERAKYKAAIHKAREEKAALKEALQRARHETDQLRTDSSKVEGLLGQYGRQVEQLSDSVASTQQQYEVLKNQGVSGSLVHLEDSHQRIMEQLQLDNTGLRSEIATLRRQQEESSGRIGEQPPPVASTSVAVSTPVAASMESIESLPMATAAVDGMEEDYQVIQQDEKPGSSLDASLHLQRRLLAARQELTDSRLSHLRTRIASLEGQLKGKVDGTAHGGHSEPQPLNQEGADRHHSGSRTDLKDFQAKLEAAKKDKLRLIQLRQRPQPTS